jgi:hypothetical protein
MKPIHKIAAVLLAATAFVTLFYHSWPGINYPIYFILLFCINFSLRREAVLSTKGLGYALLTLIASIAVAFKPCAFSVIAFFANAMIWSWYVISPDATPLAAFIVSACNAIIAPVAAATRFIGLTSEAGPTVFKQVVKGGAIVLLAIIVSILFFNLYKASNPIFADNMSWLTFKDVKFDLIFVALLGIVVGILTFFQSDLLGLQRHSNRLHEGYISQEPRPVNSSFVLFGMILFSMLNIMLLILVVGDIPYLFGRELPQNISLSKFVHEGVNALIISICLACGILLVIFNHKAVSAPNLRILKPMGYGWMVQTVFTIIITYYRNYQYVAGMGFTYKRVGVYYWLLLTCAGLFLLFLKISKERSLGFVLNNFLLTFLISFTGFACINWDRFIVAYNLKNTTIETVEWRYMIRELDDSSLPLLAAHMQEYPDTTTTQKVDIDKELMARIGSFKKEYLKDHRSWRSWNYADYSTHHLLEAQAYYGR